MNPFRSLTCFAIGALLLLSSIIFPISLFAQLDGKKLFRSNCARCHKLEKDFTGPALRGVEARVPQPAREWIVNWVHNSNAVIASGDEYGIALFEKFGKTDMDPFPNLKEEEIFAIPV